MNPLSENATFVERVVRFLELRPWIESVEVFDCGEGTFSVVASRSCGLKSRYGLSRKMTTYQANKWCMDILGANLGDVWNCDRVTDVDPETKERMDA